MTAETDLLPLPEMDIYALGSGVGLRDVRHTPVGFSQKKMSEYAHANVARATAAKDAELVELRSTIEALRAEVERLTFEMGCLRQQYDERTACMIVHRGAALACSDAVRAAYSEEHERADKLAEALALLPDEIAMVEHNPDDGPLMFCCGREVNDLGPRGLLITHDGGCWYARMRALRDHDQEDRND